VYSISSKSSLVKLKQVRENLLNLIGNDAVPIILVAQKCDLTEYREVSSDEGRELASRWNCPYLEVSAKMNRNVGTSLCSFFSFAAFMLCGLCRLHGFGRF
jgi:GTPase SAR1 family protein